MYTLHIANKNYSSWSLRPWILMTELDIPFKEIVSPFVEDSDGEEFKGFCPTSLVPCLLDGDVTVWDSLAIAEYLAEDYPEAWPKDRVARAWARSASAEMHSGFMTIRDNCSMNCALRIQLHTISPALQRDIDRLDELWNEGLSKFGGPFLAGDSFTVVDAFFAPVVFRIRTYGLKMSSISSDYAERILSLEGMKQWDSEGIKEPWRESSHEEDAANSGKIIHDFRQAES